ncbi:MAG: type II secretion system protein [Rariglobus sp.]
MLRITPSRKFSRGFTLVELLAVIAIIGVLAAIVIPVVGSVRASARTSTATSNLRQLAAAQLLYASENKSELTPVHSYALRKKADGSPDQRSWMMWLMPYVYPEITTSTQLNTRRVAELTVFDVPESERLSGVQSIAMNSLIATPAGPADYRISAMPRPSAIIMLGELVEGRGTDTMDPHDRGRGLHGLSTPAFRRSGEKALMAFCDGHVEPKGIQDLAFNGKTQLTNPWTWK